MKIAAVQYKAVKEDLVASREGLVALAHEAAAGSTLLVLPEMAITGYCYEGPDDMRRVAEPKIGV